ncbi:uncharacterized protein BP5553_00354 [Venustampulla echinocandica]|uniref:Ribosomal protein/NADH dehydrogenase domain-containing protein n=1 Tax=Venustampulla echinocandica TaxID=2656787 RepID=A0A370TXW7_9HELO|nr:uncharacterized protein BP5553_00354 [Venustampulla echinocandica]RDL40375.1 hypothetical protein BP5553_00354 [Venustampulla echinocandica]
MVNITRRMTKLTALLQLRVGSGAAILPPEVERIHLEFARARDDGHSGPRVFWRNELRRLKYYNPSIPMTISRSMNPADPATMEIHFKKADGTTTPESSTETPPPTTTTDSSSIPATENPKVVDIKGHGPGFILHQLITYTNAKTVEPTEEDLVQLEEMKEKKERGRKDSVLMQKVNKKRKEDKEKDILARGGMVNLAES